MGECVEGGMLAAVCEDCAMHEPLFHGLFVKSQIKWLKCAFNACLVVWTENEVPANSHQLNRDIKTNVHVKPQLDVDNDDHYSMQPQGSQRLISWMNSNELNLFQTPV